MILLVEYGEKLVFLALFIASILALAVGLERTIIFRRNTTKHISSFIKKTVELLRLHDLNGVEAHTGSGEIHIFSRFSRFALEHYRHGHNGLTELMEGKIIEERIILERRLSILNTLGNNAPFIGLLGTVLGVIRAFHGLGTLGNTGAEVVMRSISSALLATAAGLFVAIPVVMANNYFSRKVKIIIQNLEMLSREFIASYNHSHFKNK